jgi:hypothetical protein
MICIFFVVQLLLKAANKCMDSMSPELSGPKLFPCHGQGGNQVLTSDYAVLSLGGPNKTARGNHVEAGR